MKIKHYNSDFSAVLCHVMVSDYGDSNVDKSFFRPDISSVRAFLGSQTGSSRVGLYDFNDGKDTGATYQTLIRDKALDITEVDSMISRVKQKMSADIAEQLDSKKSKEKANKDKILSDNIQKIADSAFASSDTSN